MGHVIFCVLNYGSIVIQIYGGTLFFQNIWFNPNNDDPVFIFTVAYVW